MKRCFTVKQFPDAALSRIATISDIMDEYSEAGYDLSLRQLYYQLVARGIVENTEASYKRTGVLVSDARLAGLLDWDMIKDRGRETVVRARWRTPADILHACANQYHQDLWVGQDVRVEVMVEKQALEGVLEPVCQELDVPFTANKGYSSSSALYESGARIRRHLNAGLDVVVLYLGDHDPSGIDMTRDIEDRLNLFAEANECYNTITVERLALNIEQVRELNPPDNPAKITDSRAAGYIKKFGTSSWELDAIEPAALANIVRAGIERRIDPAAKRIVEQQIALGKEALLEAAQAL